MKRTSVLVLIISNFFTFTINASYTSKQWVYKSFDGDKIELIWNNYEFDNTVVAVIDTGANINHPDLRDQLWVNEAEKNGIVGVDDDNNGHIDDINGFNFVSNNNTLEDTHGHGTHVAGIIGAAHNGIGINGINPSAKLMILKAFDGKTSDALASVRAIRYAVDNGAKVINCSWIEYKDIPELEQAVNYATSKGVIVVGAAGNSGKDINRRRIFLANYKDVIIVGNLAMNGRIHAESNYGTKKVDILAPGEKIYSTDITESGYSYKRGTSMAAPFVSGAISLLLSIDPNVDPFSIKERLYRTGTKRSNYKVKSKKRINVYNFIKDD
ncbi:S8 family peptidase [Halobacteriovorax sp. HLS]|uniref:S8 family peptidase n=1 Tax=Halobacteriovorax sp. HLS TaxID=2234000 RepID=UPI000FDB43B2|nr:S8 family peptidase [Halobacteriovorax sp. HLS]